jgi:hypothetical protein
MAETKACAVLPVNPQMDCKEFRHSGCVTNLNLPDRAISDTDCRMNNPTDYPTEHAPLDKIEDVDLQTANLRLKDGWLFIRCYVMKHKINDVVSEQPRFVMGKPKPNPDL